MSHSENFLNDALHIMAELITQLHLCSAEIPPKIIFSRRNTAENNFFQFICHKFCFISKFNPILWINYLLCFLGLAVESSLLQFLALDDVGLTII